MSHLSNMARESYVVVHVVIRLCVRGAGLVREEKRKFNPKNKTREDHGEEICAQKSEAHFDPRPRVSDSVVCYIPTGPVTGTGPGTSPGTGGQRVGAHIAHSY